MKESWKPVTISGMTGILMGTGAMYAANAFASDDAAPAEEPVKDLQQLTSDGSLSFRQAFDAARAELGPGGVFRWHGNIYNTYTADEWNAMSHAEKQQFAERVNIEIPASQMKDDQLAGTETDDPDVTVIDTPHVSLNDNRVFVGTVNVDSTPDNSDDDGVRVLGYGPVQLENGQVIDVQELDMNGQRVAIIDVDRDGEPDYALSDANQNRQLDEGEVIDLHTGEPVNFTNDNNDFTSTTDEGAADIDFMPA
jgi:hypothetical protein